MTEEKKEKKSLTDFLEKDTFIKIVYIDTITENDLGVKKEKTRAFFGDFIDSTEDFIIVGYPNGPDKIFIKISSVISISEESKK